MSERDRIAEPWGERTPSYLGQGLTDADVDRWAQSASMIRVAEPEVRHVGANLARWSDNHARGLVDIAAGLGFDFREERGALADVAHSAFNGAQLRLGQLLDTRPEPALLLLADLRRLYLTAAGTSVLWELLAQGAQATRQQELADLAARCHPDSLRKMRWANGTLKTLAPQIIAS